MKILIVGLGGIGQRHARNLRAILGNNVDLLAWRVRRLPQVITPSFEADVSRNVEEEYKIRIFDNLSQSLAQNPDAAMICNPTSHHLSVAQSCAEHNCHLFIEKPVSHSLAGLPALLNTVKDRNLFAMRACAAPLSDLLVLRATGSKRWKRRDHFMKRSAKESPLI